MSENKSNCTDCKCNPIGREESKTNVVHRLARTRARANYGSIMAWLSKMMMSLKLKDLAVITITRFRIRSSSERRLM